MVYAGSQYCEKLAILRNPHFWGTPKISDPRFCTFWPQTKLKLGKHVPLVIFSRFKKFGKVLKEFKNFSFWPYRPLPTPLENLKIQPNEI